MQTSWGMIACMYAFHVYTLKTQGSFRIYVYVGTYIYIYILFIHIMYIHVSIYIYRYTRMGKMTVLSSSNATPFAYLIC